MKFRVIISVHNLRQRTHSKIHETHKIPVFSASENSDQAVYFVNENPRFGKIYAETHEFPEFFERMHSLTPSST